MNSQAVTMEKRSKFYIGRKYDMAKGQLTTENVMYDPANLTTHGIVTGMTGSGKTGLCIGILEEAALQGIPAIIIDIKGDLTNLILHFPDLKPTDFEPWLDADEARRQGMTIPQMAVTTAEQWKKGLAEWDLGHDDILALKTAVDRTVYTPGSTAGIPVSIVSSFATPDVPWESNKESLREKISTIVTALLGLIGLNNIDPLRSREHILLCNLIETAWSTGKELDLMELILQVQTPPIARLGAFPLDSFFPPKDRMELAMLLNNFLASPTFQTWMEGQPLNIPEILFTKDGKPRHSIFYVAHLSDNERMFFVTLLFAAIEGWMRTQRGTSGLRALVYFDEIVGYMPPVANPPSRPILLRMLKQARAFGVGMLLATQNPVDVDYKALSNAGTWIIGRLQTDQDKQRLMDGLTSATGSVDRSEMDRLISAIGKRVFVMRTAGTALPIVFSSRFAMDFLAGPASRDQIGMLNQMAGASAPEKPHDSSVETTTGGATVGAAPKARQVGKGGSVETTSTRPAVPSGVDEFFLPTILSVEKAAANAGLTGVSDSAGITYRPALIAQAEIRYLSTKYNLSYARKRTCLLREVQGSLMPWDDSEWEAQDMDDIHGSPQPRAVFGSLPSFLSDGKRLVSYQKEFVEWLYRTGTIKIRAHEGLKVYAGPDVSTSDFRKMCDEAVRSKMGTDKDKTDSQFVTKINALKKKIDRAQLDVENKQQQVGRRNTETLVAGGEVLLGFLTKRKRSLNTPLSKNRMANKAKDDLEVAQQTLKTLQDELKQLEEAREAARSSMQDYYAQSVNDAVEIPIAPTKSNIFVELFGIIWLPYYRVQVGSQEQEVPAF